MLKCDGCGIDLCYTVRYKGTYFCNDCSPVMEINKEDYLKGHIDKRRKKKETVKTYSFLFNGKNEFVMLEDYLKVVEEKESLENKLNSLKCCEENPLTKFRPVKDWRNENEQLRKELETITKLCNERGKRIEVFETHINELKRVNLNLFTEGSGKSVNEIKCCLECQVNGLEEYLKSKNFSKLNHFIKNSLKEDCEVCKGKAKKVEMSSLYGEYGKNNFVDSWMLSYKVKGMKEPIIQHHLTKEECEIIYGNMNNVTYWFMELMGE